MASTIAAESAGPVGRWLAMNMKPRKDCGNRLLSRVASVYEAIRNGVEEGLLVFMTHPDVRDGSLENGEEGEEGNGKNVAENCVHGICLGHLEATI